MKWLIASLSLCVSLSPSLTRFQLQEGLTTTQGSSPGGITGGSNQGPPHVEPDMELLYKLHQIRDVLERSKIAGFNRKLQLKPRKFEQVTVQTAAGVGPDGESLSHRE